MKGIFLHVSQRFNYVIICKSQCSAVICWLWLLFCWKHGCLLLSKAFSISASEQDSSLQWGLWQPLQHRLSADRVAGTHFLLLLPSSGHTFFVTLRFSLQEIVTKDEDKKTITCPEQLISVSCICMSAKILPYTETLKRPQQTSSRTGGFVFRLNIKVGRTQFSCKVQHYTYSMSPPQADGAATFLLNAQFCPLITSTTIISWPLSLSLGRGEINSDKIFSGRNTFQKIIRNQQNGEELVRNLHTLWQSAQRVEPPVKQRGRPTNISHIWIIICGLFHNMGGIGCCLLRNVYVAPQSSGEILIWCETELIN